MRTKGSITAECCICSFVLIISLLLCIQIIGYANASSKALEQLEKRLYDTSISNHTTGIYVVNVVSNLDIDGLKKVRYTAVPYEHCFTMGIHATYEGVLKKSKMQIQAISAKWSGDGIVTPKQNIWDIEPLERGDIIHNMMGSNLDRNFPVLDIYDEYTKQATSIISINTQDASYKSGSDFKHKITQQIDAINNYTGSKSGDVIIDSKDIYQKSVIVVIPNEKLTDAQTRQINEVMSYAKSLDIGIEIKKYQKTSN